MPHDTVPALIASALASDPGRPFVTYYDEATGERIELSVATTANWVSKTANMLQDSLAADDSTTVSLRLPAHWESVVWHLACWSVGCTVVAANADADLVVLGPEVLTDDVPDADEVVALSLRPLGARFAEALPAGVVDYNAEVLGHGDVFSAYAPPTPASHADLVDRGRSAALEPGERVLVVGDVDVVEPLLGVLVAGGSLVLLRDSSGAEVPAGRADDVAATERVSRPTRGPASR
ncbi:TIGR03089 family protein [Solicola sp. PLA-1-18]|uniref:TIGR03089 family protein n=1 Tax=Solicola sp. PLA-1-18 TaxID=3380532 RepID=UPI003B7A9616